jgi:hypothetical protein
MTAKNPRAIKTQAANPFVTWHAEKLDKICIYDILVLLNSTELNRLPLRTFWVNLMHLHSKNDSVESTFLSRIINVNSHTLCFFDSFC